MTVAALERHITAIFAKLRLSSDSADHRRMLAALRYLGARSEGAKIWATGNGAADPYERQPPRNGGTVSRVSI